MPRIHGSRCLLKLDIVVVTELKNNERESFIFVQDVIILKGKE